jgi:hypothetical protein
MHLHSLSMLEVALSTSLLLEKDALTIMGVFVRVVNT